MERVSRVASYPQPTTQTGPISSNRRERAGRSQPIILGESVDRDFRRGGPSRRPPSRVVYVRLPVAGHLPVPLAV